MQGRAGHKGRTEHQQGQGEMHDLRTKSLPEKASPASPQNPLQTTNQLGNRAWANLGLQEKGSTALQKHKVWVNEADASF